MAVTSAMDKTRAVLHTIGNMIFWQIAELMNPATNNGLPPNLTADEPSCDFLLKGMDVASASYQSELGFLQHGTVPFVMTAELGNQSINSMALMSARYTHKALDVYMQLCSNALLALCQALDLRSIQHHFYSELEKSFFSDPPLAAQLDQESAVEVHGRLWSLFKTELGRRMTLDTDERSKAAMTTLRAAAVDLAYERLEGNKLHAALLEIRIWATSMTCRAGDLYKKTMNDHSTDKTSPLLGRAPKRLYCFIREDLAIPFLVGDTLGPQNIHAFKGTPLGTTIGTFTSRIYQSLRNGGILAPVMESLREALKDA